MSGGTGLAEGDLVADRYRVRERIGEGGMGVVYRATDTRLRRDVALKQVLLRGLGADEQDRARRRTLREAEIAARVHHPRIVSLFDVLDEPGGPLLVLEYLPARSLGAVVSDVGVLTPGAAARVGAQVAEALAVAHAAGIVHRDVKPGNVLVGPGDPVGPAKLADFGISHVPGAHTLTSAGIGTPAYFSPEVARGVDDPGPAADVYALGATLTAVTQGAPPFGWTGENPLEQIRRIATGPVPAPTIGGPLGELVARMTDTDPARRPSAADAAAELDALADRPHTGTSTTTSGGGAGRDRPDSRPTPPAEPTHEPADEPARPPGRRFHRRPAVLVTAAVVLAAAVVAATVVATRDRPAPAGPDTGTASTLPASIPALAIGDVRTADPCSPVPPSSLNRYGDAQYDADYGNFASCTIRIARGGQDVIDVETRFRRASQTPPEGARQQLGQALIVREPSSSTSCNHFVVLADGTPINLAVTTDESTIRSAELCAIAETATVAAANTLATSGIGRRAPGTSALWTSDACSLLTPADLTLLPPANRTDPSRRFAGWECDWGDDGDPETTVKVAFDRRTPPDQAGGAPTPIPGGTAWARPDGGDACNVEVEKRAFLSSVAVPLSEVLRIKVGGPGSVRSLCDRAVALARAADARI